jgi:IS605 OrfB family transposase
VEHLLHIVTAHFIRECVQRGVKEIAIGDLAGLRDGMDYGARVNQQLHAWLYRKVNHTLRYEAALVGIAVRDDVDEGGTSRTCHGCGRAREASRIRRGLYRCPRGWAAQADANGALNIYERAFQVISRQGG